MNRREILGAGLAAPFVASLPRFARAATWPEREISLILPLPPGSAGDLAPRTLMGAVGPKLGVPIVMKNVPGAGGALSLRELGKARPDGYTLGFIGVSTHVILPRTANLEFNPMADTSLICQFCSYSFAIAVPANSPIKNIADLVAEGKKRQVNFSSMNVVSTVVAMFTLAKLSGTNLNWVKTATTPEAITQAAGSHTDAIIASAADLAPLHKAGTLRIIASASQHRYPPLPDIPTIEEQGYPAYSVSIVGLCFPKGVPEEIRARMESVVAEVSKDPELIEKFKSIGLVLDYKPGAEFATELADIDKQLAPLLVQAGMAR